MCYFNDKINTIIYFLYLTICVLFSIFICLKLFIHLEYQCDIIFFFN